MAKAKATEPNPLVAAADNAVENTRCRTEYAKWLTALASSIHVALDGGKACVEARIDHAKALAGLAQFLAYELTADLGRDASELQAAVDAAEAEE